MIVFIALLAARMTVGPDARGLYLLSVAIAFVPLLFAYANGYLGGGTTKLAAAVTVAFLPLPAAMLVAVLLIMPWVVRPFAREEPRVSGSGVILALCAMTVAALALFGRPPVG
jgi:hypothetical protein